MANEDCNYDKRQPDPCDRTQMRMPRRQDPCAPLPIPGCTPDLTRTARPVGAVAQDLAAIEYMDVQSVEVTAACPSTSIDGPASQDPVTVTIAAGYSTKTIALPVHEQLRTAAIAAAQAEVDALATIFAYSQLACRYGHADTTYTCPTYADQQGRTILAGSHTISANTYAVTLQGEVNAASHGTEQQAAADTALAQAQLAAKVNANCMLQLDSSVDCAELFPVQDLQARTHTISNSFRRFFVINNDETKRVLVTVSETGSYTDFANEAGPLLREYSIAPTDVETLLGSPQPIVDHFYSTTDTATWDHVGPVSDTVNSSLQERPIPVDYLVGFDASKAELIYPEAERTAELIESYLKANCSVLSTGYETVCPEVTRDFVTTVADTALLDTRYTLAEGAYSQPIPLYNGAIPDIGVQAVRTMLVGLKNTVQDQANLSVGMARPCTYGNDAMLVTCGCDYDGVVDCLDYSGAAPLTDPTKIAALGIGTLVWYAEPGPVQYLGIIESTANGWTPGGNYENAEVTAEKWPVPLISRADLEAITATRYLTVPEGTYRGTTVEEANEMAYVASLAQLDCSYANPALLVRCGFDTSLPNFEEGTPPTSVRTFYRKKADIYYTGRTGEDGGTPLEVNSHATPSHLWSTDSTTLQAGVVTTNCIASTLQTAYDLAKMQLDCLWCNPAVPGECLDDNGTGGAAENIQSRSYVAPIPAGTYCSSSVTTTLDLVTRDLQIPDEVKTGAVSGCLYDAGDVYVEIVDTHTALVSGIPKKTGIGYANYLYYLQYGLPMSYKYRLTVGGPVYTGVIKRFAILPHQMAVDFSKSTPSITIPRGSVQIEMVDGESAELTEQKAVKQAFEQALGSMSIVSTVAATIAPFCATESQRTELTAYDETLDPRFSPRKYADCMVNAELAEANDATGAATQFAFTPARYALNTSGGVIFLPANEGEADIDHPRFFKNQVSTLQASTIETWVPLREEPGYTFDSYVKYGYYRNYGMTPPVVPPLFLDGYTQGRVGTQILALNPGKPLYYVDGTPTEYHGLARIWMPLDLMNTARRRTVTTSFDYTPLRYVENVVPPFPHDTLMQTTLETLVTTVSDAIKDTNISWFPDHAAFSCTTAKTVQSDPAAADLWNEAVNALYAPYGTMVIQTGQNEAIPDPAISYIPGVWHLVSDIAAPTHFSPVIATQLQVTAQPVTSHDYLEDGVHTKRMTAIKAALRTAYLDSECSWGNVQTTLSCASSTAAHRTLYANTAVGGFASTPLNHGTTPITPAKYEETSNPSLVNNSTITAPAGLVLISSKLKDQAQENTQKATAMSILNLALSIDCSVGNKPVLVSCYANSEEANYGGFPSGQAGHEIASVSDLSTHWSGNVGYALRNWDAEVAHGVMAIATPQNDVKILAHQYTYRTQPSEYGANADLVDLRRNVDLQAVLAATVALTCQPEIAAKTYKCSETGTGWDSVAHGDDSTIDAPLTYVGPFGYGMVAQVDALAIATALFDMRAASSLAALPCVVKTAAVTVGNCSADKGRLQDMIDGDLVSSTSVAIGGGLPAAVRTSAIPDGTLALQRTVPGGTDYIIVQKELHQQLGTMLLAMYQCEVGNSALYADKMCMVVGNAVSVDSAHTYVAPYTYVQPVKPIYEVGSISSKQTLVDDLAWADLALYVECEVEGEFGEIRCFDSRPDSKFLSDMSERDFVKQGGGIKQITKFKAVEHDPNSVCSVLRELAGTKGRKTKFSIPPSRSSAKQRKDAYSAMMEKVKQMFTDNVGQCCEQEQGDTVGQERLKAGVKLQKVAAGNMFTLKAATTKGYVTNQALPNKTEGETFYRRYFHTAVALAPTTSNSVTVELKYNTKYDTYDVYVQGKPASYLGEMYLNVSSLSSTGITASVSATPYKPEDCRAWVIDGATEHSGRFSVSLARFSATVAKNQDGTSTMLIRTVGDPYNARMKPDTQPAT